MAAEASNIVAAVGCHAMYRMTGEPPPQTYSAVPIMEIHGAKGNATLAHLSSASMWFLD